MIEFFIKYGDSKYPTWRLYHVVHLTFTRQAVHIITSTPATLPKGTIDFSSPFSELGSKLNNMKPE